MSRPRSESAGRDGSPRPTSVHGGEGADFLKEAMALDLSEEDVAARNPAQGWIAALKLAALR